MVQLLSLIIVSFFISGLILVPFIDLLFHLKRRYKKGQMSRAQKVADSSTPIHNQLLAGKDVDTPVGGGIIVILEMIILSALSLYLTLHRLNIDIVVLIVTVLMFGMIGLIDDLRKIFISFSGKYAGIKGRAILVLQILSALTISLMLYFFVGLNNIYIPVIGNIVLGWWYIPLSMLAIISFANAYNVSDGMDGLSTGLLTICLFAFLALANTVLNLDLAIFVGVWIGALIAYLYFNVYPARVYLGDAGAFGFGATLAVIGLLTGKILGLAVIGGMFVIIIGSSLLQIIWKRFLGKKLFAVAPIHMYFKYKGWEEPKIVVRFWLAGGIFAILGLWLALLSK
ncbi:hypothetical protein M1563_01775 [Patescibacteria group bacterium]|nr:hypothetical protein [Patescibacteria group bacterium]